MELTDCSYKGVSQCQQPPRKHLTNLRYQILSPEVGIAIEHSKVSVAGYRGHLHDTQSLFEEAGQVLFRIDQGTGTIVWQTHLPVMPAAMTMVPGNRIMTMVRNVPLSSVFAEPAEPYELSIYSADDGELLTAFTTGLTASVVAAGETDMFVVGIAPFSTDFHPGEPVDEQGDPVGVYMSRYTF